MKRIPLTLALALLASTITLAEDKELKKESKLISEIIESLEQPALDLESLKLPKLILIYNAEGKLLHSFSEDEIIPLAMRNTDFLIEDESSKIFIKL